MSLKILENLFKKEACYNWNNNN